MSECGTCKEFLPADAFVAHCSRCDVKFHFDCTVISESSWRSLGPDRKAAWRCVPCKEQKARRLKQTQSLSQPSPQAQYTGEQLSIFVLLYMNFNEPKFRQITNQTYALRQQRFRRRHVYTEQYGSRRLEYVMPKLLNEFCNGFMNENNNEKLKKKLKESILRRY
ncbi:hypothetical protein M8J76_009518 [Diaphorina citri]|nr:hypothetical protein M8J76_009518 [Diaphorina citri]